MLRQVIRPVLTQHSSFIKFRHTSIKVGLQKPVYSEPKYTKEESDKVLQTVNVFENVNDLLK